MRRKAVPKTKSIHAVIERFEGDIAVIETESRIIFFVPTSRLPEDCRIGHHLQVVVDSDEVISATIDEEATARAKESIEELMARLRRGDHLKKRS